MNLRRTIVSVALMSTVSVFSATSQAAWIDFTSADWSGVQGQSSFTQDGITVSSSNGNMTFNSTGDQQGCKNSGADLACAGDGIGIGDDEITGQSNQSISVTFDSAVDIIQIELLDLFQGEGPAGADEVAVITVLNIDTTFSNPNQVVGGYLATGFQANGVTNLTLTAQNDSYSDYALARITTIDVAEPASFALFGLGLMGVGALRRRAKK
ncbi:MAG: hypothetical protein COA99_04340 [Moraxellaceae bacterium]|nr:MAG: hypothetical protein COA99_04340 [Moraxellaceae bacterium]